MVHIVEFVFDIGSKESHFFIDKGIFVLDLGDVAKSKDGQEDEDSKSKAGGGDVGNRLDFFPFVPLDIVVKHLGGEDSSMSGGEDSSMSRGGNVDSCVFHVFIGDAEFSDKVGHPRFVLDIGFHLWAEVGVDGGVVHVEVTTSMDNLFGDGC